jgi:hypothetical protein
MKILFINLWFHPKNLNALLNYGFSIDNIDCVDLDIIDLNKYDVVYSPTFPINVKKYPNTKFLFGPHFDVFPNKSKIDMINSSNTIYVLPSEWNKTYWKNISICNDLRIEILPFGVNTDYFTEIKPISDRDCVFIYFKHRDPYELNMVESFLQNIQIPYKLFCYDTKYNENDYLEYLQKSKYGIWLSGHESQGFALEEALSCNVPLLVWNVTSMSQEYGQNYTDIPATSIPYWHESCGESFTKIEELPNMYDKFIKNIENYEPRKYILDTLSMTKCKEKFEEVVEKIKL